MNNNRLKESEKYDNNREKSNSNSNNNISHNASSITENRRGGN